MTIPDECPTCQSPMKAGVCTWCHVQQLRDAISEVQWAGEYESHDVCPWCYACPTITMGQPHGTHEHDCTAAKLMNWPRKENS